LRIRQGRSAEPASETSARCETARRAPTFSPPSPGTAGGKLYSIDIRRDPREPPHEFFVPDELQPRWELIIGDSRRELPSLVSRLPPIDMFHHDSLHTFEHMTWEFETALPHLSPQGVLSSDDVRNPSSLLGIFRQNAFPAFCESRQLSYAAFHNLGVGLRRSRDAERTPQVSSPSSST
jgi:hypothetical protein